MRCALALLALVAACDDRTIELFPDLAIAIPVVDGAAPALDLAPDLSPACVCRFALCRVDSDCQAQIGAASTCGAATTTCSGGVGSCRTASDCSATTPSAWQCTVSATSTTPCP
jgi:hypothetical protein